jgi:hypothetical protein
MYTAASNTFTWDDFFANTDVSFTNDTTTPYFADGAAGGNTPAGSSSMNLSSSINLFGLAVVKDVKYGPNGEVTEVYDSQFPDKNRWVISTKMETPVLDFSDSTPREIGYSRGMWGGYGLSGDTSGAKTITLELAESFTSNQNAPADYVSSEHNFLNKAFRDTGYGFNKPIGQINEEGKEISEAIVAIPYLTTPTIDADTTGEVYTTQKQFLDGRYLISLGPTEAASWDVFKELRKNKRKSGFAVSAEEMETWGVTEVIRDTSISEMAEKMEKYVIPPELDFATYDDVYDPENFIEPFVMYIFEFTHKLDKQDLTDIWQGLMPKISTTAELDSNTISHPRTKAIEFFGDRNIPDTVRWMVFKVKKKAATNYYKITADTRDDQKFDENPFSVGDEKMPYSYNWPYDYFSLVELAELEAGTKFKK